MDIIYKIRFFRIFREIRIYFEYLNQIRLESVNSPKWSKLKLRKDWIGRIYTVINLPPEVTQSPDFPKEALAYYEDLFSKLTKSASWDKYMEDYQLEEGYMNGAALGKSITAIETDLKNQYQQAGVKTVR
jgi:hypothetical protein